MTRRQVYLDAAVALYAAGRSSVFKDSSRRVLSLARDREIGLHASVEVIQEFMFHRMRTSSREATLADAADLMRLVTLHDFDRSILEESMRLIGSVSVRGRDAVHAATALVHGIPEIVSPDRAFDDVPGLRRIDPSDF